jgi:hypothetical protein
VSSIVSEKSLRALVDRCRELADTATDTQAADALRQIAAELEALIIVVRGELEARRRAGGHSEDRT